MSVIGEIVYRAKLAMLSVFGPATLDEEHDPIAQLKREHDEGLRQQRAAEADESEA